MTIKNKMTAMEFMEKHNGPFTFAKYMRVTRDDVGLTQVQMAKKLKISPGTLCDLEKGRQLVSVALAAKIAKLVGETPHVAVSAAIQDQLRKAKINLKIEIVA